MIFRSRNDVRCFGYHECVCIFFGRQQPTGYACVEWAAFGLSFIFLFYSIGCSFAFYSVRERMGAKIRWKKVRSLSEFSCFFFLSISFPFDSICWLRPFSISTFSQRNRRRRKKKVRYCVRSFGDAHAHHHIFMRVYQNRLPGNFRCLLVFCALFCSGGPLNSHYYMPKKRTNFIINSSFVCYCRFVVVSVAFVQWWIYLLSLPLYSCFCLFDFIFFFVCGCESTFHKVQSNSRWPSCHAYGLI